MARVLATNVVVDEKWYGPAYGNADSVPDDVAARIGDHAWTDHTDHTDVDSSTDEEPSPDAEPGPRALADLSKAELVEEAERRGVDTSGTKAELLTRLEK